VNLGLRGRADAGHGRQHGAACQQARWV
jgi:hypothetical protein